jgi:hypothetical protein
MRLKQHYSRCVRTANYADSTRQNGALCDCRPQIREIAGHSHVVVIRTLQQPADDSDSSCNVAGSDPDKAAFGRYFSSAPIVGNSTELESEP